MGMRSAPKRDTLPKYVRELWNHQFQGGVADILNTTIVAICEALPEVRLVYTAHDAGTIACRADRVEAVRPTIEAIVTRPIQIGDRHVRFPAKFSVTYAA
jgi:DNA polymerase I-like protein with 3'-5' exonuclease and polymerase domains